jgi:hypothetical protein
MIGRECSFDVVANDAGVKRAKLRRMKLLHVTAVSGAGRMFRVHDVARVRRVHEHVTQFMNIRFWQLTKSALL